MTTTAKQLKHKDKVGIIIVAKSDSRAKVEMTQQAISSAKRFAGNYDLEFIVAEDNPEHKEYDGAEVFHHHVKPFNYNKVLNLSRKKLKDCNFIMFCNNDLVFTERWLDNLLENPNLCLSPKEPNDGRQAHIKEDTSGYLVGTNMSGWCFGLRKEALDAIGDFDESYQFWFSDNVVSDQLEKAGIIPTLVVKSIVHHLGSKTLQDFEGNEKYKMTYGDVDRYERTSGNQTELTMKEIGRTREGRILANQMLPKV